MKPCTYHIGKGEQESEHLPIIYLSQPWLQTKHFQRIFAAGTDRIPRQMQDPQAGHLKQWMELHSRLDFISRQIKDFQMC